MPTPGVILTALPRRPVRIKGSNGESDAAVVRPRIPYGATAWSVDGETWRPLHELPNHWMPFLNRQRGTEMDARPATFEWK
jgi:hypothetical protein